MHSSSRNIREPNGVSTMGDTPDKVCLCCPWDCCVRWTYNNQWAIGLTSLTSMFLCPGLCWVFYVDSRVLVLPDDAKKVDWEEEDSLWARLQGRWQIVYVSGKPSGCCSWTFEVCFNNDHTQQEITGSTVFEWKSPGDGPKGPKGIPTTIERERWRYTSQLKIYRTPDGRLYIDTLGEGDECTRFSPEEGVVSFKNGYGKIWEWRREPCTPVTVYPAPGLEGALAPPMGCPRGTPLQKFTSDGSYEWACQGLQVNSGPGPGLFWKQLGGVKGVCTAGLELGPHPGVEVWKCAEHFNRTNPAECDYMQCDKCKCRCDFNLCNECKTIVEAQPITSQPITSQPITSQPITSQPITSQPMTSHPITSQPMWPDQPPVFEEPKLSKGGDGLKNAHRMASANK